MSRGKVENKILDGALGSGGIDATGIFGVVGVSSKQTPGILILTDPTDAKDKLGDGPLRDMVVSDLAIAKTTIYTVTLPGTIAGILSAVAKSAGSVGVGSIAVSGSPLNAYSVKVLIKTAGGLNEAVFQHEVDGVISKLITVPAGGVFEIPDTGIILTFDPGVPAGEEVSFDENDLFTFSATAPAASNEEILTAVDTLLGSAYTYEWISIAGISDNALWAALSAKAILAEENFRYIHFKCQARYLADGETIDEWVGALTGVERGVTESPRVQVYAGWLNETDPFGSIGIRGGIGLGSGMSARREIQEPVDAVKYGAMSGVNGIAPEGLSGGQIDALDNAGYVTFCTYIGRKGVFITHGRMLAGVGSDFRLEERRRVMDKACAMVRTAQLIYLNDTVEISADGSMEGIEMFKAVSEQALKNLAAGGAISSGEVIIDEGQDILATETIKSRVRIIPLGKMSYIENTISYANPALEEK